jgi:hypothetical protein
MSGQTFGTEYVFRRGKSYTLRADLVDELRSYVTNGTPLGDCLRAAVCNDFKAAVARADSELCDNLVALMGYIVNEMPAACQGSPSNYHRWLRWRDGSVA